MPATASPHIVCVIGTRPELIKMAPVVRALSAVPRLRLTVLCSGQHRELLAPLCSWFGIAFDHDLHVMTEEQSLAQLTSRLASAIERYLERARPDFVLAQGDTTTAMCVALCCFYLGIPFAHVEAGLRTRDLDNPFPEEFNRLVADRLARLHFCPSERAARNLTEEGVPGEGVRVTGNTVIDALLYTVRKLARAPAALAPHDVLLTVHRRESFGAPLENVLRAVRRLVEEEDGLSVLYPVHPNPNVRGPARALLGGHPRITLAEPLDYPDLVRAMQAARFILTDSGGIQEEAPVLGKPVLVLRRATERPEVIEAGVAELVGTEVEPVLEACRRLLSDPEHYARMARRVSPYGDGRAAERIRDALCAELERGR
ncbi:MAG TPA: UDP-N-acetylglucosamine 2-epimerase (non-hydrolyzing) [Burkholderiales bacterium]|nr:UDP-N-acetylglucosamine 2-epimerase (non-hydrolyzing) [Burkholderiales bacterium]